MLKCLWKWIFLQIFRSSINVVLPNRNPLIQRVIYETLPKFCKVLGHTTRACSKDNVDARPVEKAGSANELLCILVWLGHAWFSAWFLRLCIDERKSIVLGW